MKKKSMKKIVLGLFALTMTFASIAQSKNQHRLEHKEFRKGGMHEGAGYMEKLNLTDAQKTQVKTINEDFRQQMQNLKNQGSLTVDQQKEKRQALAREHRDKLNAILTPEQRKQAEAFKQDFKGKEGDFSEGRKGDFKDGRKGGRDDRFSEMTKDLNLTPEQSTKLATLNENFKNNLQSLQQNSSLSKEEKKEQMKSLMQKHKSEMESLLTTEQKKQLKNSMKNRSNRAVV
jgi:Spy/CpxP family protein refolding chaperone